MKAISEARCEDWASRLDEAFSWSALEHRYGHVATYVIPADAGRKTALARAFSALSDGAGETLVWITAWGIFPSSQNMELFDGYRRSLNESRSIAEAPGHIFDSSDRNELECVLDLVLYFFWDASVFAPGGIWIRISHDEVFSVRATDTVTLNEWQEALAPFDLEILAPAVR